MHNTMPTCIGLACSILLAACGGSSSNDDTNNTVKQCSLADKHAHWYSTLQQDYLWNDELASPSRNFANYLDSNDLLNDVLPGKDRFSLVINSQDWQNSIAGNNFGFGVELAAAANNQMVVVQTFNGSAAQLAGIERGDTLTSVGNTSASTLHTYLNLGNYNAYTNAFGPDENGFELEFSWINANGDEKTATLKKSQFQVNTVTKTEVVDSNAGKVAYLGFQNGFLEPSPAELKQAFGYFKQQSFDHFVLDLRDNTGGLVSVAAELALYLASDAIQNQIFLEFEFNQNNQQEGGSAKTEELVFTQLNGSIRNQINYIRNNSLNLDSLIVLTNGRSASASEVLINSLEPYINVHMIGERTYGKPVGFLPDEYCEETLLAVNFQTNNALGFGDYLNGLTPDCFVSESNTVYPWTSLQDPVFAKAIGYLNNGYSCSATMARPSNVQPLILAPHNRPNGMLLQK
ncbi:carboxyl-terminal protease [Catenovulum agarivorans DS-2]|uniref:Carboxyl-terminal protease n=1 Tax=Catenovulum agarivorans DS-2 TaxID=1328313 RepID=W7QPC9_9ALTE|nr:S41 family peptidase [Catenovulum agarivorans]EWH09738.1 carboxyl-terminal protease [Catenovulum agarivorans DS-2]